MIRYLQADVGIRHKKYCSSIADFLAQMGQTRESTQRPMRERLTLCVEGNISAGKSTFLQALVADSVELQDHLPFSVVPEPVAKWQGANGAPNLLQMFYQEPARYAYTFQNYVFMTRVMQEKESNRAPEPMRLMERSVFSDRMVFVKAVHEAQWMNDMELSVYDAWFDPILQILPSLIPDGFIYLRAQPQTCLKRLQERARSEEGGVNLGYLENLHEKHESWLFPPQRQSEGSWGGLGEPEIIKNQVGLLNSNRHHALHPLIEDVPALILECDDHMDLTRDLTAKSHIKAQVSAYYEFLRKRKEEKQLEKQVGHRRMQSPCPSQLHLPGNYPHFPDHAQMAMLMEFFCSEAGQAARKNYLLNKGSGSKLSQYLASRPLRTSVSPFETAEEVGLIVAPFARSWVVSQPVPQDTALPGPTAQQWLRRRGPGDLSNTALQALFRQRQVRIWTPGSHQLKRASRTEALPSGTRLLIPPGPSEPASNISIPSAGIQTSTGPKADVLPPTRAASVRLKRLAGNLRKLVLYEDRELMILNKPAGLAVQGGSRIPISLDDALPLMFAPHQHIQPRLVHRLDRHASGALVVALTSDAAAWLSAAFRAHSDDMSGPDRPSSGQSGASVHRTYWAIIDNVPGAAPLADSGMINAAIGPPPTAGAAPSQPKPASTQFQVLARHSLATWLHLQPKTGRKHQLRIHCATHLGRPIVGDSVYGEARASKQQKQIRSLQRAAISLKRDPSENSELLQPTFAHNVNFCTVDAAYADSSANPLGFL
ncbi:hypothetical protein WJX84_009907 [Apatococcus fuscideae]|uniref:Uncharacterized protein n=1 Tax=Apatococcus fuscideae TaxID=2026836 RepID=A0AAW1SQG9_9CHLO